MPEEKHIVVSDINNIVDDESNYGYWQTYLFDFEVEDYEPVYNMFIYYKGKFFTDLSSKPWTDEEIHNISLMSTLFNKEGNPICIFRKEKNIE